MRMDMPGVQVRTDDIFIHLTVASFPELSQKLDRAFVGIIPVGGETDEEN